MRRMIGWGLVGGLWLGLSPVWAAELSVTDAWARPTPPMARVGGVFLTLTGGDREDRLLGASSPVADAVELHTHRLADGVAVMESVPAIPVPAGQTVVLQPGGLHIMLIGLGAPLKEGQNLTLNLRFAQAGEQSLQVPVIHRAGGMMGGTGPHMPSSSQGPHSPMPHAAPMHHPHR